MNLDIFVFIGDVLNVIWAKKSLVYIPSNQNWQASQPVAQSGFGQRGDYFPRSRVPRSAAYGDFTTPHELSCPWQELSKLTKRLQGDKGAGAQPLPDLMQRFAQAGFGRLRDVRIERLGPCSGQPQPFVPGKRLRYQLLTSKSKLPIVYSHTEGRILAYTIG